VDLADLLALPDLADELECPALLVLTAPTAGKEISASGDQTGLQEIVAILESRARPDPAATPEKKAFADLLAWQGRLVPRERMARQVPPWPEALQGPGGCLDPGVSVGSLALKGRGAGRA